MFQKSTGQNLQARPPPKPWMGPAGYWPSAELLGVPDASPARSHCVPGRQSAHTSVVLHLLNARTGPQDRARKGEAEQLQALTRVNTSPNLCRSGAHSGSSLSSGRPA